MESLRDRLVELNMVKVAKPSTPNDLPNYEVLARRIPIDTSWVVFSVQEHAIRSWPRFVTFRRHVVSIAADSPAAVLKLKTALLKIQLYQFQKLEFSKPKGDSKSWAQVISDAVTTLISHLSVLRRAMRQSKSSNHWRKNLIENYQSIIVSLILILFRCLPAAYELGCNSDSSVISTRFSDPALALVEVPFLVFISHLVDNWHHSFKLLTHFLW